METLHIDPVRLYPRLKVDHGHAIYHRDLGRHMFLRQPMEGFPVTISMLEDVMVQFALDNEDGFDLVQESDRAGQEEWGDMGLIQQSFRNLRDNLGENMDLLTLENGLLRLVSGGKYEASFLLLSNLWLNLEAEHGHEMYAAIPSHNALLIGKADDREAIMKLQEMVRGVFFESDRDTLLSKAIYRRYEGEWKIVATAF